MLQQSFGYDAASRLQQATNGAATAGYVYLANSPLVSQIGFTNGSVWMKTAKQYDNLNRLTSVASSSSGGAALSSAYGYNAANQRVAMTNADGTYWP